jgi:hypothetical protein
MTFDDEKTGGRGILAEYPAGIVGPIAAFRRCIPGGSYCLYFGKEFPTIAPTFPDILP